MESQSWTLLSREKKTFESWFVSLFSARLFSLLFNKLLIIFLRTILAACFLSLELQHQVSVIYIKKIFCKKNATIFYSTIILFIVVFYQDDETTMKRRDEIIYLLQHSLLLFVYTYLITRISFILHYRNRQFGSIKKQIKKAFVHHHHLLRMDFSPTVWAFLLHPNPSLRNTRVKLRENGIKNAL